MIGICSRLNTHTHTQTRIYIMIDINNQDKKLLDATFKVNKSQVIRRKNKSVMTHDDSSHIILAVNICRRQ